MTEEYFWIIGGGLLQIPVVAQVKSMGYSTIVTDANPDCVCAAYADRFINVDIFDIDAHIAKALEFLNGGVTISGVLAAGIDAPETAARTAQVLNLPTVSPLIANLVHHKGLFRDRCEQLGYPTPRYQLIDESDLDFLDEPIGRIGYPLIIKNTDSSASRGTRIFLKPDPEILYQTARQAINVSHSRQALIEELWEGPEHTVETIFDVNGQFHPCFITDRIFDKANGFAMEIGLRHPTVLPQSIQDEMYALAKNVAQDIGIKIGAAKFDMMSTKQGPRIIEMTTRLSGGFDCQYLVPAATGKQIIKAAVLTALGQSFPSSLLVDVKGRVALSESLWPKPGILDVIEGVEQAKEVKGFEHIFFRYKVGDKVLPYEDCSRRFCFIITSGETEAEARSAMEKVKRLIIVRTI